MRLSRDLTLIYAAALLRSLGIGLLGVLLGIYLFRGGASSLEIGLVIAAGLAGAAVATVVVSFRGDRLGRRRTLIILSLLSAAGGLSLALVSRFASLLPLAFVGMLNGMGTDRTAAFAMEQAIIPGLAPDERRTWTLSWYNLILDTGHALGALAAGIPFLLQHWWTLDSAAAYKFVFFGYAGLNLLTGVFHLLLSRGVELARPVARESAARAVTPETKRIITRLAALFSLDSFGGGFLTDALVSYWFFRRFGVPEQSLGVLFFAVHILNAVSHLGAAWLARRIGLLNTMVFTHLPSSLLLIAVPFAPSFKLAVLLFLLREGLVEMDVPTRQSYIAAVVRPEERTFASGITNLTRNVFWAIASSLAGVFMQNVAFSAPLVVGGGMKIGYDILLYQFFRGIKPPEERAAPAEDRKQFATAGGMKETRSIH
jgi:MFS family permease